MARNSLAPGFMKFHYTVASLLHNATIPVRPVFSGGGYVLLLKNGTALTPWTTHVDDFIALVKPLFSSTGTSFDFVDLFTQADEDSAPVFVDTYDISLPGTSGSASVLYSQFLMTFRSTNGGRGKLQLMETVIAANTIVASSAMAGAEGALRDYIVDSASPIATRDEGFNAAAIRYITKTNDKLRKNRLNL